MNTYERLRTLSARSVAEKRKKGVFERKQPKPRPKQSQDLQHLGQTHQAQTAGAVGRRHHRAYQRACRACGLGGMGCGGSKPDDAPAVETKPEPATKPAETKPEPAAEEAKAEDGPLSQGEIENRIKGMDKPETFELGISGFILRYGVLSQRGYYPEDLFKQNQDRYLISPNVAGEKSSILLGVFDGHGQDGHECADFVRKQCIPTLTKMMKKPEYQYNFTKAYIATWVTIDAEMHEHDDFNDFQSGSTSICAVFRGKEMYVSNIGDSRAIIGERNGKRILAQPLSIDQTPYRADERERVKACGATIMTQAMMLGDEDYTPGWDDKIGAEDLDGSGEPPRIYDSRKNQWGETEYLDRPGTAFTRSIGDSSASHLGVSAEAELLHKQITEKDQMIALASDGVWEFLTNQSVCDTIMHFDDPIEACRQVISQAYGLWLQFEVRTDDITLIVAFIDMVGDNGKAPRPPNEDEIAMYADRKTMAGDGGSGGLSAGGGGFKPVRRGLSAEKKKELGVSAMDEDDDTQDQGGPRCGHAAWAPALDPPWTQRRSPCPLFPPYVCLPQLPCLPPPVPSTR